MPHTADSPVFDFTGTPWTDAQVAEFERRWREQAAGPKRYRYRYLHPDGKTRRYPPLPWKTRARLRARRITDTACIWRHEAPQWIWRALRMALLP